MIDINKFKAIIIEKHSSIDDIALELGINKSTIYRKLQNNGDNFTIKEVGLISSLLHLTISEIINIFFANYVA